MYKGEKRGGQAVSPLGSAILLHVECFFTCWFVAYIQLTLCLMTFLLV